MITSGIYKIEHISTGRIYIGSAVKIIRRWQEHKSELLRGIHGNKRLQNSWNKHGEQAFKLEVVEKCECSKLIEREQFYIDTLNPYYNIARIAGSTLGYRHTEETKDIIRQKRSSQVFSDETRAKFRSKTVPIDVREKISLSSIGRVASEESKEKMRKSKTGTRHTYDTIEKIKSSKSMKYTVTSPIGDIIETDRLKQFCKERNLTYQIMSGVANGIYPHHKGWKCAKKENYFDTSA